MLPFATTSITITRDESLATADGYDSPAQPVVIADGVPATIGAPTATAQLAGGDRVTYSADIRAVECDLQAGDSVTDGDGTDWVCLWAKTAGAFGLRFTMGQLRLVVGAT